MNHPFVTAVAPYALRSHYRRPIPRVSFFFPPPFFFWSNASHPNIHLTVMVHCEITVSEINSISRNLLFIVVCLYLIIHAYLRTFKDVKRSRYSPEP